MNYLMFIVPINCVRDSWWMISWTFQKEQDIGFHKGEILLAKTKGDVIRYIQRCRICHIAKCENRNTGLYKPFLIPKASWKVISVDF